MNVKMFIIIGLKSTEYNLVSTSKIVDACFTKNRVRWRLDTVDMIVGDRAVLCGYWHERYPNTI